MALDKEALSELLEARRAGGDLDVLRSGMQLVLHISCQPFGRPPAGEGQSPMRSTTRVASPMTRAVAARHSAASPAVASSRSPG